MTSVDQEPGTILVVDDEVDIVLATRLFLEGEGYAVLEAGNGVDALRVLGHERPDLIILDVMMPGLNGWDTLALIQADDNLKTIPVIMLTAMDAPEHVATGITLGCTWYYTKPITDYAEFALVIRRVLAAAEPPPGHELP
jgi:CheY-like chemotaxis protein